MGWDKGAVPPSNSFLFPLHSFSLPFGRSLHSAFFTPPCVAQLDPRGIIFFLAVRVISQLLPWRGGAPWGKGIPGIPEEMF